MKNAGYTALGAAILISGIAGAFAQAAPEVPKPGECPKGVKVCKIMVITPDEEQTLIGPGGVFDQAVWASRSTMSSITEAWKQKIAASPAGKVAEEDKKTK